MNLPKAEIDRETAIRLWIEEHSDYAKEQIVLNNVGIVGIVLKSLNLNPFDEDLFATGLVGVVKAVNTFNLDKGVKFPAYATQIIRNEILMIFRKKRIVPYLSLDELCRLEDGNEVSYADMIADNKRFEDDVIADTQVNQMIKFLNGREKAIISLRMGGKKQREIAEILGLSQAQISRIIKSACEKCKKMMNEEAEE